MNELKGCFKYRANVIVFVLLMSVMVSALFYLRFVYKDLGQVIEAEQHKSRLLWEMESAVRDRAFTLNAMSLLDDPFEREARYEDFLSRAQDFMIAWRYFWKLSLSAEESQALGVLDRAAWRSSLLQRDLIDVLQMEQKIEAKRRLLEKVIPAQNQVFSAIEDLMHLVQRSNQGRMAQAATEYRRVEFFIVLSMLLLFVVAVLITWKVLRNLNQLQASLVSAKKEVKVALQKRNKALSALEQIQAESRMSASPVQQSEPPVVISVVSGADHSALRILVAEDNLVNQQVVVLMLEQLGYADDSVDLVVNGKEAFDALQTKVYDLIFMDLQMPIMGGEEATRKIIGRYPVEARPRIVAMTANNLREDREHCLALGMDDYLSKPLSLEKLSTVLAETTRRATVLPVCQVVDVSVLEALRADMVDGALVLVELLNNFFSESKGLLSSLHQAKEEGSYEKMGHALHSLKSSSLSLGANAFSERCRILEQQIRQDKMVSLPAQIEAIDAEYQQVCKDFNALLGYYEQQ